mmetsp:Transcript_28214/g.51061  ORF Transcript_28214/g.51061 Transcript_28214/m.51061 type:complete len:138 (-) Transcript_28214:24-437(-)
MMSGASLLIIYIRRILPSFKVCKVPIASTMSRCFCRIHQHLNISGLAIMFPLTINYLEIMSRHRAFNGVNAQDSIHSQMHARWWLDERLSQANESMPFSGFSSHTQQQHAFASASEADQVRALEQELKELKRKVAQL